MATHSLTIPIRGDKFSLVVRIKEHLCHRITRFQTIDVYDTDAFGRVLTLDGHVQLSELDERVYHEYLVHVPLMALASPNTALVVGGGDGGVIRELCKYRSIEHIDLAEIDEGVIEEARRHLPFVSADAFDDPRVTVHITDAFAFVKTTSNRYDLIVVDSTDSYEEEQGGLSEQLFTAEFYSDCRNALTANGLVVTQADNPVFCPYSLDAIQGQFQRVFAQTGGYFAVIPSFGGLSAYCWGSMSMQLPAEFATKRTSELRLAHLNKIGYEFGFSAPLPALKGGDD